MIPNWYKMIKETPNNLHHRIRCLCHDPSHDIEFIYDIDYNDLGIWQSLRVNPSVWKRIKQSISYIFHPSSMTKLEYFEVLCRQNEVESMRNYLNQVLEHMSDNSD